MRIDALDHPVLIVADIDTSCALHNACLARSITFVDRHRAPVLGVQNATCLSAGMSASQGRRPRPDAIEAFFITPVPVPVAEAATHLQTAASPRWCITWIPDGRGIGRRRERDGEQVVPMAQIDTQWLSQRASGFSMPFTAS